LEKYEKQIHSDINLSVISPFREVKTVIKKMIEIEIEGKNFLPIPGEKKKME